MLGALVAAHGEVPEDLRRFHALATGGAARPSFEEYSARVGGGLAAWRETCYFDVATDPSLVAVANERFARLAVALGFSIPDPMVAALAEGAVSGPDVLQVVLGIDAAGEQTRLKYYLIFRDRSGATVERLRQVTGAPVLPTSLEPDSVYILGLDFRRAVPGGLSDFKLYVRLDADRVPRVVRNLREYDGLRRRSRYLVFQHCLVSGVRRVYFHLSSPDVLEAWLGRRAGGDPSVADLRKNIAAMNLHLRNAASGVLRPWIVSFPYEGGGLEPGPSNIYFHYSE